MKKFFSFLVLICTAVMILPCDAYAGPNGQKVKQDKVVKYALKQPIRRASGSGEHFNESSATSIAEMNARAEFARKIENAVMASSEYLSTFKSQTVSNNNSSASLIEGESQSKDMVSSISSQILRNVHVVKKSAYYQDNKTYKVYVCVEFMGTPEQMFTGFAEVLERNLSEEDKVTLEVHQEEMRKVFTATMKQ